MDLAGPRIRVTEIKINSRKKIQEDGILLKEGDLLELTDMKGGARAARYRRDKTLNIPARIVVQPENLTSMLKSGERIFFDDGKFESRVIRVAKESVLVEVIRVSTKKPYLRATKGVNLPDSKLAIPALTNDDGTHLAFVAMNADLVGYSFVSTPDDLRILRDELDKHKGEPPAIILKIERLSAVENLPALLFEGMKDKSFGVMIARGDLAVEIGFERLSEVQQQILWIAEAAHVPVILATQVLESLSKTGLATRSEITDAAMGSMAECVMLNRGRHVVKTVQVLVDIMTRFSQHNDKKRFTFRPLSIARNFFKQKL
jgi:pyruvate kinase